MANSWRTAHGHRLIQAGVGLFLAALVVGLAVPAFAVPRLALSVHLLGLLQGLFLIALGLLWQRLALTRGVARAAAVLAVYGCAAALLANAVAAMAGGSELLPIASAGARSSPSLEVVVTLGLRSAAVALIAAVVLVLWGLRGPAFSD